MSEETVQRWSINTDISLMCSPLGLCSAKKSQAPPPKGKSQPTTPRSQQATPKNGSASSGKNLASKSVSAAVPVPCCAVVLTLLVLTSLFFGSNHRSSGKKATPPTSKANAAASGGKSAPRAGTRNSARLSQEILAPNSNAKTSPGQSESRKRPPTGKPPISCQ